MSAVLQVHDLEDTEYFVTTMNTVEDEGMLGCVASRFVSVASMWPASVLTRQIAQQRSHTRRGERGWGPSGLSRNL